MKSRYYKTDLASLHYWDSCSLDIQETIVFLHGFTGSGKDFLTIPNYLSNNYRCLMPDLPGHGETRLEDEMSFTTVGQVDLLKRWLDSLGQSKFHLCGYSMGGRLALQFAAKNSSLLSSLILVSTTAGINEESARLVRAKADEQLAQQILESNPVDFLNRWLAQPLFQEIIDKGQNFINTEIFRRLPLQKTGLACSLKYFSSGVMPSVWQQLDKIEVPTLVLAGSKDQKYLALALQLAAFIPKATSKILPTGHAPLVESANLFWKEITDFLNRVEVQAP